MLREFALADLVTLGNAASGTTCIFLCLGYLDPVTPPASRAGFLWTAFALLPVAFVLDALDGFVARKRRPSALGGDLDSLADIVSFGVAPAALAFTIGMRGGWDSVLLIYFVCCGIARLARFNVTASDLADASTGKVKYFEGTPIPTSLALVVVMAVAYGTGHTGENLWFGQYRLGPWLLHPLSLMFALNGSTMISATLRIPKP